MPHKQTLPAAFALALGVASLGAHAQSISSTTLPSGGRVVGGQATISQSGAAMSIQQSSARTALDWQSFSIGSQASVTFNQPSASALALNRVLGASGSEIYGRLSSNGQVFLINPNGVLFGRGAEVDVGGLVASTLGMSADDFMSGRYLLRGPGNAGSIVNQGSIRAPGGSVALIAPRVQNDGTIEAQFGSVSLVAASSATVDYLADGLVQIRVDQGALQAEIANSGVLRADGGSVTLTARALDNLARSVVNNSGVIEARSVQNVNGVVRLAGDDVSLQSSSIVSAAGGGEIQVQGDLVLADGRIDATSNAIGGSIKLLGDKVGLIGNARVDASGDLGGGQVLIGGNFHGAGPEQNATAAYVGRDVLIDASANVRGDGGKVVVWSNQATRFYGSIKATGGARGGDGGSVETSGKAWLDFQGHVDTRAPLGRTGSLLLDPTDITIGTGATSSGGTCVLTACFTLLPGANTAILSVTELIAALGSTNVSISTSSIATTGSGDITVGTPVNYNSINSLSLTADRHINVANALTNAGTGAINLTAAATVAGGTVTLGANLSSAGAVNLSATNATFNGGTANLNGTYSVSGTTTVNGGTVNFNGANTTIPTLNLLSGVLGGSGVLTVSGTAMLGNGALTVNTFNLSNVSGPLPTANINNSSVALIEPKTFNNGGIVNWTGTANVSSPSGTTFNNVGQFNIQNAKMWDGTVVFNNQAIGTITKTSAGLSEFAIGVALNNAGTVNVNAGTFELDGGGASAGVFNITSGTLAFDFGNQTISGTINNAGTLASLPGVGAGAMINFTGTYNETTGGNIAINGGTFNVNAPLTTPLTSKSLSLTGGTLGGSGAVTVASGGTADLGGGALMVNTFKVSGGATALISNAATAIFQPATFNNSGTVNWVGAGGLHTPSGTTTFNNLAGALFNVQNAQIWDSSGGSVVFNNKASAVITNAGTVDVKAGMLELDGGGTSSGTFNIAIGSTLALGGNTQTISGTINNAGTLDVMAGTLQASLFTINNGTVNVAAGATLSSAGSSLTNAASGMLQGSGTIDLGGATLTNDGGVRPGGSGAVGTLSVVGNFVERAGGTLDVELQSPTSYDALVVSGTATLNGMLNDSYLGGYTGAGGTHNALAYASLIGTFTTISDVHALTPTYGVTAFALVGPPVAPSPAAAPTTVSTITGFDPTTIVQSQLVATPAATGASAALETAVSPIQVASVAPTRLLPPDVSALIAAMSELRREKRQALRNAVSILEKDPAAADLQPCPKRELAADCIVQRAEGPVAPSEPLPAETAYLPEIGRKIALLIGEGEYQDPIPKLNSPHKDVEDIAYLYRAQFGYDVRVVRDSDKAAIVRELNRLILESGPNDSVTVFYAGHGYVVEKTGRGYWIPSKASAEDPTQWLSNHDIGKVLESIPAKQVLLVSDSCYSGMLAREAKVQRDEIVPDPAKVLAHRSVTVLTSGGEEPVSDAGRDGHSVFAWHFMRTLQGVAGWSSGVDVYEHLAGVVRQDFPQEPQYGAALGSGHERGGDFLFEERRY